MINDIEVNDPQHLKGFKVKTKPRNLDKSIAEIRRYKAIRAYSINIGIVLLILSAVAACIMIKKGILP